MFGLTAYCRDLALHAEVDFIGKSTIKPESDASIAEIAKLLKNDGTLKIYVVGHTDNAGFTMA